MRLKNLLMALFFCIISIAIIQPMTCVYAEESETADVEIETSVGNNDDKNTVIIVKVTNNNLYTIMDMKSKITLPQGVKLEDGSGEASIKIGSLNPGESKEISFVIPKNNNVMLYLIIGGIVGIILIVVLIIVFLKINSGKKKKAIAASMSILIFITSVIAYLPAEAKAADVTRAVQVEFQHEKRNYVATVSIEYNDKSNLLNIDVSHFNANGEKDTYVITEDFGSIAGTLDNADYYQGISIDIYNDKNTNVYHADLASMNSWNFVNPGLFPGTNLVVITAGAKQAISTHFHLIDYFGENYQWTSGAGVDTDGDGLDDTLEAYWGSDPNCRDTDGDGLSDYDEVALVGTDPCKIDTNDDGVNDFDEDADGDGLINGKEIEFLTLPRGWDTDGDGLNDYQELYTYNTNPKVADTDGDSGSDSWELLNGYDPLVYNAHFVLAAAGGAVVDELTPVVASVELELTSGDKSSLRVEEVSSFDCYALNPFIPGYLGVAYDFSVDGTFDRACLTFAFDKSLGEISEDFQPRIYYYDEENDVLEELPDQNVENGKVTAYTTHFSKYILLNKVIFDKAFKEGILAPYAGNGNMQIVFVIDYSGSMNDNDPNYVRLKLTNSFIDYLGEEDEVGVVKFIAIPETVIRFTTDKEAAKNVVSSITNDDGSGCGTNSGTDGGEAISAALDMFDPNSNTKKLIIFLTDGEDTETTVSYENNTIRAREMGVHICTIGLGEANETLLKEIAANNSGSYYKVSLLDDEAIAGAYLIYDELRQESIDITVDSNNDGISDYYTQLIYEGTLVLSNGSSELSGIDFNYNEYGIASADWDGDGLLNGEELYIEEFYLNDRMYVVVHMKSNPLIAHSDGDGVDDYTEMKICGSDPMKYDLVLHSGDYEYLRNNSAFYYENAVSNYYDNFLIRANNGLGALIFGVWDKSEVFRSVFLEYFNSYAVGEKFDQIILSEKKKTAIEILDKICGIADFTGDMNDYHGFMTDMIKLKGYVNGIKTDDEIDKYVGKEITDLIVKYKNKSLDARQIRMESYGIEGKVTRLTDDDILKIGGKVSKVEGVMDKVDAGLQFVGYATELVGHIGELAATRANYDVVNSNLDAIRKMKNMTTENEMLAALNQTEGLITCVFLSYVAVILEDIAADTMDFAVDLAVSAVASAVPAVAVAKIIIDGTDLLFGVSEDIEEQYKLLACSLISDSYKSLEQDCIMGLSPSFSMNGDNGSYTAVLVKINPNYTDINFQRYFCNLAQSRIYGEKTYYDWMKGGGILAFVNDWILDIKEVEEKVDANVDNIKLVGTRNGCAMEKNAWDER